MSNNDRNFTDNRPSFFILLSGLALAILPMIIALAISRILSALDFGLLFLFIKGLIYVLLNLTYLGFGCGMGYRIPYEIVNDHHGHFTDSGRQLLRITGIILISASIIAIIKSFTDSGLRDLMDSIEANGFVLTIFITFLYWGLIGAGMWFGIPTDKEKCPKCGLHLPWGGNRELIASQIVDVRTETKNAGTKTVEYFKGPWGRGKGPEVKNWKYYDESAREYSLKYETNYNELYRWVDAVRETTTTYEVYEITTKKNTYQITCEYCGHVFNEEINNQEKN